MCVTCLEKASIPEHDMDPDWWSWVTEVVRDCDGESICIHHADKTHSEVEEAVLRFLGEGTMDPFVVINEHNGMCEDTVAYHRILYEDNSVINRVNNSGYIAMPRCWEGHKPLEISCREPGLMVFGGSCAHVPKGIDIQVGLDSIMSPLLHQSPWNDKHIISHLIPNMGVPSNKKEFKAMIRWLSFKILEGKKVHVGCIGGHGRSGLVLASLVQSIAGRDDAIDYVRLNYCRKAIENRKQEQWLMYHLGMDEPTIPYRGKK